ncbi:hypothetical protein DSO57_1034487 [Entomophthora muscae]|uniref:Uncharacterized protein n=1 Tax=Entomophthora muscae TaxID=34485 RepID=A0ACC2SCR4_9FUNG|nr:hypothetical protein DSO57_1034487 [Entomophthora muscae]
MAKRKTRPSKRQLPELLKVEDPGHLSETGAHVMNPPGTKEARVIIHVIIVPVETHVLPIMSVIVDVIRIQDVGRITALLADTAAIVIVLEIRLVLIVALSLDATTVKVIEIGE